jgi:endonuclease YncB( thermonuclease family)
MGNSDGMDGAPSRQRPSRFRQFWNRRSRMDKVAIIATTIVGAFAVLLVGLALAVPVEPDAAPEGLPVAGTTTEEESTRTSEAATETTESEPETTKVAAAPRPPPPPPRPRVVQVIDGDTLDLDNGRRVRLVQIDSPEAGGECYGRKAGTVLRRLLPVGTRVRVERDPNLDDVDRYGRILRYVFRGKRNINLVMVRRGAASVWFFDGDRGRYAEQLLRAAENARAAKRGAWGACRATLDPTAAFATQPKQNRPRAQPVVPTGNCDPSYPDVCIPPFDEVGDLNCGDVPEGGFAVRPPDPHEFDGNGDGIGCEDN